MSYSSYSLFQFDDILVNNVGTNHDIPTPFTEENDKVIEDIIEVNVMGALKMTKLVLPQMQTK